MKSGPLRIGRNVNTSPNIEIAGRRDEVANIFAEQGANGSVCKRIDEPQTCSVVCRVQWLMFSNAKGSNLDALFLVWSSPHPL